MKFTLPLRHGLKAAWHHLGLVVLLYLAAVGGAFSAALVAFARYAEATAASPFAHRAFAAGDMFAIIEDFGRGHHGDLQSLETLLPIFVVMTLLVHVLFAAGLVETLLAREARREHPFLLGIGRHSWRFVRSAVWFVLVAALAGALLAALYNLAVNEVAVDRADTRIQYWGLLVVLAVGAVVYSVLDLGYDLSRIAAAAHGDGRTLVGLVKGIGHALRHPLLLLPLWWVFSLVVVALHLGLTALRNGWQPTTLGEAAGLIAVQQAVFLLAAFFRVGLWGAEVAYYQAIGEPRWCGKRAKKRRVKPQPPPAADEAQPGAEVTVYRQPAAPGPTATPTPAPIPGPDPTPRPATEPATEPATDRPAVQPSWERELPLGDAGDRDDDDDGRGGGPSSF